MKRARIHWFLHQSRPRRGGLKIYFPLMLRLLPALPKPCTNTAHTRTHFRLAPFSRIQNNYKRGRRQKGAQGQAGREKKIHKAPEARSEQKASQAPPSTHYWLVKQESHRKYFHTAVQRRIGVKRCCAALAFTSPPKNQVIQLYATNCPQTRSNLYQEEILQLANNLAKKII